MRVVEEMLLILYVLPEPTSVEKLGEEAVRKLENLNLRARDLIERLGVPCSEGAVFVLGTEKRVQEVLGRVKSMYIDFMELYQTPVSFGVAVLKIDEENLKRLRPLLTTALQLKTQRLLRKLERFLERVKRLAPRERRKFRQQYQELEREYQTHVILHHKLDIRYSELDKLHEYMNSVRALMAGLR